MKFEEQFPELAEISFAKGCIHDRDIQNNCLSKQRVKEIIENSFNANPEGLLKELGL